MKKLVASICISFILVLVLSLYGQQPISPPKEGYVPNKETAIRVAEILWFNVYGNKINDSRPFVAELKNGKVWVVRGTLHSQKGGVPYIQIQKSDCKVLVMYHEK